MIDIPNHKWHSCRKLHHTTYNRFALLLNDSIQNIREFRMAEVEIQHSVKKAQQCKYEVRVQYLTGKSELVWCWTKNTVRTIIVVVN